MTEAEKKTTLRFRATTLSGQVVDVEAKGFEYRMSKTAGRTYSRSLVAPMKFRRRH